MLVRALFASLLLALPTAISATPVSIEIVASDDGTLADAGTFSTTDASCSRGCTGGYSGISGSLSADLDGDVLSAVSGAIQIDGLGTLNVTDGVLDLGGSVSSFLDTDYGTFHFGDFGWSDSGSFWAFGNNWGSLCESWVCKHFWVRLSGHIAPDDPGTPVPEPSAALLFGVGAVVVSQRVARRR